VLVPFLDADGDPTDPTTPDTEVSQDGGAFADAAEEVTTVSGSNGLGYITLTGAEMNNSAVGVAFKVASGPKATLMTLFPRVLPVLLSGTASAGASGSITLAAGAFDLTGCIVRTTGGTGGGGTGGANNQARLITAYNTSTLVATVSPNWETTPDATTTYDILLTDLAVNAVTTRALRPTVDGRTLDVSSGGEAGLDWANIGSPTTTQNLSGTSVKTATDVETDTQDIQSRLPAALVSGRIDASVGAVANNAITASGIADGAIDRATFAADTGLQSARSNTAQAGAAGTITLDASASSVDNFYTGEWVVLTGGTGSGQARLITAYVGSTKVASIAPNWATNPDNTSTFAVVQAAHIGGVQGNVTGSVASVTGNVGGSVASVTGNVGGNVVGSVASVTGNVGGNVVGSVGSVASGGITSGSFAAGAINAAAIATDAIDADAIAADAVTEIQAGLSTLNAAGVRSAIGLASANLDTQLDALPTAAENADAVWDEARSGHVAAGSFGEGVASVQGNVTGSVASVTADVGITQAGADKVWSTTVRALTDKAGFALSAAGVQAIWDALTSALTTVGSIGKRLVDNVDATISSRLATSGYTAPLDAAGTRNAIGLASANLDTQLDALPTAAENAGAVWDEPIASHLSAGSTGEALDNAGAAGTPPTTAQIADAVWDEARSGHVTAGSFGEGVASVQGNVTGSVASVTGNVGGSVGSLGAQAKLDVNAEADTALADVGLTSTITGRIDATISSRLATSGYIAPLDAAGVRSAVGLASANLDTQLAACKGSRIVDGAYTHDELIRWIGSVQVGKTIIVPTAPTEADVTFRNPSDTADAVIAHMVDNGTGQAQRVTVTLA